MQKVGYIFVIFMKNGGEKITGMDSTGVLKTADASIVCLIILFFILFNSWGRLEKRILTNRIFSGLVFSNILIIIIDLLSWMFNGRPGEVSVLLNRIFNMLLFMSGPLASFVWLMYLYDLIYRDRKILVKAMRIFTVPVVINAALAAASVFTGWYFSFDAHNIYQRGILFLIHPVICYAFIASAILLVILKRKKIEKRNFYPLLLFFLPVLAGTVIQIFFYGYTLTWIGMTLSVLVIYFSIQNRSLNTDYLTGASNRRQFEMYIGAKEKAAAEKPFSAIALDFDGLKQINDTFGHAAGDEALIESVRILKKCIRKNDLVARTGGDEFVIIMDIASPEELRRASERIIHGLGEFNNCSGKPYKIGFSAGSGIYEPGSGISIKDFLNIVDAHMYKDKAQKGFNCSS
jgi:diguanylate cyclase (GGDEF)-like protein